MRLVKAGGIVLDGADLTDVSKRIAVTPDLPERMEIDGEPLHADHGAPLRLIGPNRPGVLQTKWVVELEVV